MGTGRRGRRSPKREEERGRCLGNGPGLGKDGGALAVAVLEPLRKGREGGRTYKTKRISSNAKRSEEINKVAAARDPMLRD